MDHVKLIESTVLRESRSSQGYRDFMHPHASGALMCPRRNILGWLRLYSEHGDTLILNALGDRIKEVIKPADKVPGVFTAGHIYDEWFKRLYDRIAERHSSIKVANGTPRIFKLPEIPGDIDYAEAIDIAGEFDKLVEWGTDTKIVDLIDYKTCKSLYMYEKKGPSMHHIAQISTYAYGLITDEYGLSPTRQQIEEFKKKTRLVLIYIQKDNAQTLAFAVDLFPLRSLKKYFSDEIKHMQSIKQKQLAGKITCEDLPVAIPSFDWECKWKTGSCEFYEQLCREEQNAIRGTAARAELRQRNDRETPTND
jgi:hypothetical protein